MALERAGDRACYCVVQGRYVGAKQLQRDQDGDRMHTPVKAYSIAVVPELVLDEARNEASWRAPLIGFPSLVFALVESHLLSVRSTRFVVDVDVGRPVRRSHARKRMPIPVA